MKKTILNSLLPSQKFHLSYSPHWPLCYCVRYLGAKKVDESLPMPVFDKCLGEEVELKPGFGDAEIMDSMGISARSKMVKEWGTNILALLYPFFPSISLFLYKQRSIHFWVYEIQQNIQLSKQMLLYWFGMDSARILRRRHKYVFVRCHEQSLYCFESHSKSVKVRISFYDRCWLCKTGKIRLTFPITCECTSGSFFSSWWKHLFLAFLVLSALTSYIFLSQL